MGHIPEIFGNIVNAKIPTLGKNDTTVTITEVMLRTSKLEVIILFDMKFHGILPPSLFDVPKLYVVGLGGNDLNGKIPQK